MRLRRRKCGLPEKNSYPVDYLDKIELPPKEKVLERMEEAVKDDVVRRVIREIIETMYSMPKESHFIRWIKNDAVRYRVLLKPEKFIDYVVAMSLVFVTYCKERIFKGRDIEDMAKELEKGNVELDEPACAVLANIVNQLRSEYEDKKMSKAKIAVFSVKWWRATGGIVKLWNNIEKNWCRW